MSGGLTSYPRTGGGGGRSSIGVILTLLAVLRSATAAPTPQDHTRDAGDLVDALEKLSRHTLDHQAMVAISVEARDLIFAARWSGVVSGPLYKRVMQVCAAHWVKVNLLASTGLAARAQAARRAYTDAVSVDQLRAAQEEAGTIALLYRMSALLGQDLSLSHLAAAAPLGTPLYFGTYASDGALIYLECRSSYNVNLFVVLTVKGTVVPLVIAGEAKGGSSRFGWVKVRRNSIARFKTFVVRQDQLLYPVTRADYMASDKRETPAGIARRAAGRIIRGADRKGNFAYIAARGTADAADVASSQEVFECR